MESRGEREREKDWWIGSLDWFCSQRSSSSSSGGVAAYRRRRHLFNSFCVCIGRSTSTTAQQSGLCTRILLAAYLSACLAFLGVRRDWVILLRDISRCTTCSPCHFINESLSRTWLVLLSFHFLARLVLMNWNELPFKWLSSLSLSLVQRVWAKITCIIKNNSHPSRQPKCNSIPANIPLIANQWKIMSFMCRQIIIIISLNGWITNLSILLAEK